MSREVHRAGYVSNQEALIKGYYLAMNDQGVKAVVEKWSEPFQRGFQRILIMESDPEEFKKRLDDLAVQIRKELVWMVTMPEDRIEEDEELSQRFGGYELAIKLSPWERTVVAQFIQFREE